MTTVLIQVAKEFNLDPWRDVGRWPWLRIWLAYRHLEDVSSATHSGSMPSRPGKGSTHRMSYIDWIGKRGVLN